MSKSRLYCSPMCLTWPQEDKKEPDISRNTQVCLCLTKGGALHAYYLGTEPCRTVESMLRAPTLSRSVCRVAFVFAQSRRFLHVAFVFAQSRRFLYVFTTLLHQPRRKSVR